MLAGGCFPRLAMRLHSACVAERCQASLAADAFATGTEPKRSLPRMAAPLHAYRPCRSSCPLMVMPMLADGAEPIAACRG
jgi:hypothetical protein